MAATMKTYATRDGEVIVATSDEALVRALRETAMFPVATDAEYMTDVAARVEAETGKPVRTGSAAEFIGDLVAAEVLKEVKP